MIYDILEEKIAASGLLVPSETLFRHYMPAEIPIGAFIRSPLEGIPVNLEMPNYYRGRLQLITRHTDPELGEILAARLAPLITVRSIEHYPANATRGEAHVTQCIPETLPIRFPRLQGNGFEWSQHFSVAFGFKPLP